MSRYVSEEEKQIQIRRQSIKLSDTLWIQMVCITISDKIIAKTVALSVLQWKVLISVFIV